MGQQRELEVTVLSAQGLKNVKFLGGAMNPYCVAWVYPQAKQSSAVDKGGDSNPTWNSIVSLAVDDSILETAAMTVQIYHHGKTANKLIGTATVPLNGQASTEYPVRTKSGKSKGVINVVVTVGKVLSEADMAKFAPPSVDVPAMGQYPQQMPRRSGIGGGAGLGLGAGLLGGLLRGCVLDGCGGGCGGGCGS